MSGSSDELEIEIKLTVHDRQVFDELVARSELAGYALRPAQTHLIHDLHWDSAGGYLAERKIGLRLRREDDEHKLTLKWPGSNRAGLFQRRELELPASPENWRRVCSELAREGLQLVHSAAEKSDPAIWCPEAGLVLTQERSTERRRLLASRHGADLAELALDTATYHLGPYEVTFREIEIEALDSEQRHVQALGQALRKAFPERLEPSKRGKYSRGLDLAARLS